MPKETMTPRTRKLTISAVVLVIGVGAVFKSSGDPPRVTARFLRYEGDRVVFQITNSGQTQIICTSRHVSSGVTNFGRGARLGAHRETELTTPALAPRGRITILYWRWITRHERFSFIKDWLGVSNGYYEGPTGQPKEIEVILQPDKPG